MTDDMIVLNASFKVSPGDRGDIKARMNEITSSRQDSQPIGTRTGGSTFKNPEGHKAWELIDQAGCRGMRIGDAQISEKHCNFLINHGDASAADIEALGEKARAAVREKSGIELQWEVRRIGQPVDCNEPNNNQANEKEVTA